MDRSKGRVAPRGQRTYIKFLTGFCLILIVSLVGVLLKSDSRPEVGRTGRKLLQEVEVEVGSHLFPPPFPSDLDLSIFFSF